MIGLKGKPYLKKGSPFFSISHCDNIVVCIISKCNVGIDIEGVKEVNKFIVNKEFDIKDDITCNLKGFKFKQEKVSIEDKEYIISIAWEGINEQY